MTQALEDPGAVPQPLRLLLVDHDPTHVVLVQRAFARTPHRLTVAASAADARRLVADTDFALVEQRLPDGEGLALLRELRVPGVLLSEDGDETLAVAAIKAGALDYVAKRETWLERLPRVVGNAWRDWVERQERDAMAEALARSEQHLRLAQGLAGVASFEVALGPAGTVAHASDSLLRALGREPFSLGGLLEAVHPEDRPGVRAALLDGPPGREQIQLRFRVVRPNGDVRHQRLAARVRHGADGKPSHLLGALVDLTDREEVADLLRSREVELRHAQKMEAVGRLANGVAHDFNNLLMGVIGCAEIALGKLDEANPARPYVDAIKSSAASGTSVVAQLLTFGRRPEGTEAPRCTLDDVLDDTEKLLRALLDEDIHFHVTRGAPGLSVECEAGQLEQALVNLAVNARHAMPEGGTLVVSTHETRTDDGTVAVITVADDGVGMTPETRSRIFEPFFTTKPKEHGTGLGLSMVYGLVHSAGGRIEVESEVGLGSVFRLFLPAEPAARDAPLPRLPPTLPPASSAPASPPQPPDAAPGPAGRRVLLVEDHAVTRLAMTDLLGELGWTVHATHDAATAEQKIEALRGEVDAIIADLTLPDERGDRLVQRLRRRHPHLAVLFLTGLDPEDDAELARALRAPHTDLARKPVELAALADQLEALLRRGAPDLAGGGQA